MILEFHRPDFVERRRAARSAASLSVAMRERGRSALHVALQDLSPFGCRVEGYGAVTAGSQVWIKLQGLESLCGHVAWAEGLVAGIEFEIPLHPAVAARFVPPAEAPRHNALEMPVTTPLPANDELLSRREQIIHGIVGSERSPLQKRKGRTGLGLDGFISRQVMRRADTRAEERFAEAVSSAPGALRVAGCEAVVGDVSTSGLKVRAALEVAIGDKVTVEFEGFEPYEGTVVWLREGSAGISLPPDTLELCER